METRGRLPGTMVVATQHFHEPDDAHLRTDTALETGVVNYVRYRELLIVAALNLAGGCGPTMKEYRPRHPPFQFLTESPAILVGFIEAVDKAGWTHSSRYDDQPVQLCRIRVKVENVLQGQVTSNEVNIYCYLMRGSATGLPRMYFDPGDRYIFYLRRELGEWRTACDVYEYCVDRVLTGRHPAFKRNPNRPISDDILEILFTRGESVSDGVMVDAVAGYRNDGSRWRNQRAEAYSKLLQRMAKVETAPVRAEACDQLKDLGKPCE